MVEQVPEQAPAPVVVATPAPVTSSSSKFTIVHGPYPVEAPVAVIPVARPAPVAHPVSKFAFVHHAAVVPHVFTALRAHPVVLNRPLYYPRLAFGNYKGSAF